MPDFMAYVGHGLWLAHGRSHELNPVRAKLVGSAERWAWSSARAHVESVDPTGVLCFEQFTRWSLDWGAFFAGANRGGEGGGGLGTGAVGVGVESAGVDVGGREGGRGAGRGLSWGF